MLRVKIHMIHVSNYGSTHLKDWGGWLTELYYISCDPNRHLNLPVPENRIKLFLLKCSNDFNFVNLGCAAATNGQNLRLAN